MEIGKNVCPKIASGYRIIALYLAQNLNSESPDDDFSILTNWNIKFAL